MIFQRGLFGDMHRMTGWMQILQEKVKEHWYDDNLPKDKKEEINRLIIGETLTELAKVKELCSSIRNAPSVEFANKFLLAFFIHPDTPALETLARGLRKAKEELDKLGLLPRNYQDTNGNIETYDELLLQMDKSTEMRDSDIEHRFGAFLRQILPGINFAHNDVLKDKAGNHFKVDFVCRRYGLVIEIDGYQFHNDSATFTKDRQKWRWLRREGFDVLVFSGTELSIDGGFHRALAEIKETISRKQ